MKYLIYYIIIILFILCGNCFGTSWLIYDNYIGGGYHKKWANINGDVVSDETNYINFNINNMIINVDKEGNIIVNIKTNYTPNIINFGTDYGDLFISTSGWKPYGLESYQTDKYNNTGTNWDFVFDTSTKNLYKTKKDTFILSQDYHKDFSDTTYRKHQYVQIDHSKLDKEITKGKFIITKDIFGERVLKYYGFNLKDMGLNLNEINEIAFRWQMTCANDVIEGTIFTNPSTVPETDTFILFGIGLLIFGFILRKKNENK